MALSRFLRVFYAYVFLLDFILGYAIYTAYFSLNGLGVWDIALLFIIWSIVAGIFEIPSGALSDHLDRRWLLIAAPLIKSVTFVIWALDSSFWAIALGFLIWSFASSLVSGSKEAMLYEHMEQAGAEEDYDKVLGRDRAIQAISAGIAMMLGGFVGHFSMVAALWLALPPLFLATILAFWLTDVRAKPEVSEEHRHYLSHFAEAARELRDSADLRFLTAYLVLGVMLFYVLEEFDPLYYLAVGLPIWAFGLVGLIAIAAYAGASVMAHRMAERRWVGWLFPMLAGACLIAAGAGNSIWLLAPLMLAYIFVAPPLILAEAKFQKVMGGASRATTTSAMIFFHCLASVFMCLAIGWVADSIGILAAYFWCGAYLLLISLWALWRDRRGQSAV